MKSVLNLLSIAALVLVACDHPGGDSLSSLPVEGSDARTDALSGAPARAEGGVQPGSAARDAVLGIVERDGKLVRERLRGTELSREAIPVSGVVMATFGQSRSSGEVLYSVRTETGLALYRVQPDGPSSRLVVGGAVLGAQWSPDGDRILYHSSAGELFVVDRTGDDVAEPERLAQGVLAASFSPDGRRIALVRSTIRPSQLENGGDLRRTDDGLYLHDLTTGREVRLSSQVNHTRWFLGYQPAWSPDGSSIVYLGSDDGQILWIASTRADSARPLRLEGPVPGPVTPIFWSSDGRRIFYGAEFLDRASEVWAVDLLAGDRAVGRGVIEGRPVYARPERGEAMIDTESGRAILALGSLEPTWLTGLASQPPDLAAVTTGIYDVTYEWPLATTAQTNITSWFSHSSSSGGCSDGGSRYDCSCNGSSCRTGHRGTDLAASLGTSILAAEEGTVTGVYTGCGSTTSCSTTDSSCNGGAGNYVVVRHSNGAYTRYLHQKGTVAAYGASVSAKTLLGTVGSTGSSSGCHLHFDISYSGVYYDPYSGSCSCNSKSLWKSAAPPAQDPFGALDSAAEDFHAIRVKGWAIDPDTSSPIDVHVYVDGALAGVTTADLDRPDVGAAHPGFGDQHGYDVTVGAGVGTHSVCTYGINVGEGHNSLLGCLTMTVTNNPIGEIESAGEDFKKIRVRGWAIDPDSADPIDVHIYMDRVLAATTTAGLSRPDVSAAYPGYGDKHGFDIAFAAGVGTHSVCVYAINVANGNGNPLLGCRSVVVSNNPVGTLDSALREPGGIRVVGWAIDPDTTAPIGVHVYVDNLMVGALTANLERADVGAAFPGYGSSHGYSGVYPAAAGTHNVCTYALNTGSGTGSSLLGCRGITVSNTPYGVFDGATAGSKKIRVQGWAIDPDTANPIDVHLYVDGSLYAIRANLLRADVGSANPGYGDYHGFDATVSAPVGKHNVCAYAINAGAGSANPLLACKTVTVSN